MVGNTGLAADQGVRLKLVALHRSARQPVREFTEPITVLGSGSGCDLILASSSVDAYHAAIVKLGNAAYLCDLGASQGTSLNGRRVRWARFAHRDVLELGSFRFGVELQESPDLVTGEQPVFSLRNEATIGLVASIDPVLIVGSDPGCDVVLQDDSIAPRHCIIVWTQEGPVIRDLQRRRATRLNGRDIDKARLMNGDSIGIGPYELLFETNAKLPESRDEQVASLVEEGEPQMLDLSGGNEDCAPLVSGHLVSEVQDVDLFETRWKTPIDSEDVNVPGADILMAEETHERAEVFSSDSDAKSEIRIEDAQEHTETTVPMVEDAEDAQEHAETTAAMAEDARNLVEAKPPIADDLSDVERSRLIEDQTRKLSCRKEMLRVRVSAAQQALDKRARMLKEGLDKRREQVKRSEIELQRKAAELVEAAREKHQEIEVISQHDRDIIERERRLLEEREAELAGRIQVLAETDARASLRFDAFDDLSSEAESFADVIEDADDVDVVDKINEADVIDEVEEVDELLEEELLENLDGGEEVAEVGDGEGATEVNTDDVVSVEFAEASSFASERENPVGDSFELSQRASELAELVRFEREEIEQSESRLQALRFDIERMRTSAQRSRSRYQDRLAEIEARSENLSKQGDALEMEREPLLHKLRDLDARAATLQTSVQDTKQHRLELDDEGKLIVRSQEQLEGKEQDLRAALEKERHRLRVQQAELQHRAAELTKAARKRRHMIEARVSERQAQLEQQATELEAQREAIESDRRREFDTTIRELGQVVGVRMAEIDAEVRNRQAELNAYMEKFGSPDGLIVDSTGETGFAPGEESQNGEVATKFGSDSMSPEPRAPGENRLELLQKEIKALHDAMVASEDIDADAAIPQEIRIPPSGVGRDRSRRGRRSENVDVQLVEEAASFRAGSSSSEVSDAVSEGKK